MQVPKIIRWELKLEPDQVLRVGIGGLGGGHEFFLCKDEKLDVSYSFSVNSLSCFLFKPTPGSASKRLYTFPLLNIITVG